MGQNRFVNRHVGPTEGEVKEMLKVIGVSSVDELISQVIPDNIRLHKPLDIPQEGMSEYEYANHIAALAEKNNPYRTFIGMGYYPTATLAVVMRNIFEDPSWYTSYTPYQAEISQGRLEALLNFQTMVTSMTKMEISNCSLLDEGTASAEAMSMMLASRSRAKIKDNANVLFVDENIFPQTLDVLLTRSEPFGIEIVMGKFDEYEFTGKEFGAILQNPACDGTIRDFRAFAEKAHAAEVLVTAVVDFLSLAIVDAPGDWGADIAVGSTQRMGIPMGYGGPSAAYLATNEKYKRIMPGRIIGISVDRLGNKVLRMALQTREQHIKREKATSNICTAQALLASMAGMFAVYHGPEGIKDIAVHVHSYAKALATALESMGYKMLNGACFFDTITVAAPADKVKAIAEAAEINFFYPNDNSVRLSMDEVVTLEELNAIVAIFAEAAGKKATPIKEVKEGVFICDKMTRKTPFLQETIFNLYRSETDLMRYIHKLVRRDISLTDSMISLGSCTMKLNSAASMLPLSSAKWGNVHPFIPFEQAKGYHEMMNGLNHILAQITGFAAVSNQATSGASGEYTGLMVIRNFLQSKGQSNRNVALIPTSAHGTNPASAVMAGMHIVLVDCDEKGNIDVADFKAKAEANKANLACAMITYPSTHGIFEPAIRELCDTIHANGGQLYMDGANMNAQVCITNPGFIGADVCHLNLHKTFSSPHGGGGPGVGTIGVAKHLVEFLPTHPIVAVGGSQGVTAVSSSPWGSAFILPIAYAYVMMLGEKGLRKATEMAIVNANYMACSIKKTYGIVYSGATGRVGHEMIVDCRTFKAKYGIETGDIARRLMDFGFHAPTLSFPVHETLMVEPTESENKAELDRFLEALNVILDECKEIESGKADKEDNALKMAPHTAAELISDNWNHSYSREKAAYPLAWIRENKFFPYVSKIDNGYGDRNLVCSCQALYE
ncbi:MAG: aminomethyl-transferring glycine dehydrogenase [Rikenellaceae bacterium]